MNTDSCGAKLVVILGAFEKRKIDHHYSLDLSKKIMGTGRPREDSAVRGLLGSVGRLDHVTRVHEFAKQLSEC
jgi:hypothetical protein